MVKLNVSKSKKLLMNKKEKGAITSHKTKVNKIESSEKVFEKIGNRRFSVFVPTDEKSEDKKTDQQELKPKTSNKF